MSTVRHRHQRGGFFCVVLRRFSDVQPGCDVATTSPRRSHVAKTSPGRRQDVNRTLPRRRHDVAATQRYQTWQTERQTDRQTDTWPQSVTDRLRYANKLPRISAKTNRFKNSFICCCLQQFAVWVISLSVWLCNRAFEMPYNNKLIDWASIRHRCKKRSK